MPDLQTIHRIAEVATYVLGSAVLAFLIHADWKYGLEKFLAENEAILKRNKLYRAYFYALVVGTVVVAVLDTVDFALSVYSLFSQHEFRISLFN